MLNKTASEMEALGSRLIAVGQHRGHMTTEFAIKWGFGALAVFGVASLLGITFRIPLPHSAEVCLAIGSLCGAMIVGPIVYVTLSRIP